MAGIQLSGLASGLDTQSIISQLMAVEQAPRTQITDHQSQAQARHDILSTISSKLTLLKTAATALKSEGTWGDTQTVGVSDSSVASARRTAGAASGGYDLSIQRLASADQHTYAFASPSADSSLNVNGTNISLSAGATVDDAVSAINASDTANVYAVAVDGKLVLSAKATGAANQFTASGGALTEDTTAARPGADAQFTIDGVAKTSASNVVANALPGVELTLKAKTTTTQTVTVGDPQPDLDGVTTQVKAFVSAYNDVIDTIRSATTEQRVVNPSTTADKIKGVLSGDSGLNDILNGLRSTLTSVSGLGISTGAASATINSDSVAGKISFDETAFRTALAADPATAKRTLSSFDDSVEAVLNPQTQAGGIMESRINSTTDELSDIADSLTNFDLRMTAKQDLLQKQFTALETTMNQNQSVQSSLASLLASSS